MGTLRRIAAMLVSSCALGACDPSSTPLPVESSPLPSGDPGTVACDTVIGGSAGPPTGSEAVLDDVVLPVGQILQPSPTGGSGSPRLFAKQGLLVRAGARPELRIPTDWDGRAWIAWGQLEPADVVTVSACPPVGSDPWIAFAGGYYVDEPACVPVVVRSGGREATVRIGIGVSCT